MVLKKSQLSHLRNGGLFRVTERVPREGKRSRGWHEIKWRAEIRKFAGTTSDQGAQHRGNWRSLGEAFVLQWT